MSAAPSFPSLAWFERVRELFNADDSTDQAGGGYCNCSFGVKSGAEVAVVTMSGEACESVSVGSASLLDDVDFYLEMAPEEWQAMLSDIAANGRATLSYTLNTLDLDREDGLAASVHNDQYREDLFFRYNQTLQYFFDASAAIETAR